MKQYIDSKMVIWLMSLVFMAGGGWMSLGSLGDRVTKLEDKQDVVSEDIRTMMKNQAAMCHALEVDCQ
jgi:hypothetical protein